MTHSTPYVPPKVWTWEQPAGGPSASANRPLAGPRHDTVLPRGKHGFQLYSQATQNGQKVTILFEELLAAGHDGADYDAWLIDIDKGDQFGSDFVAINPNAKIPALLDLTGAAPLRLFESGSILMHLAEKFGAFLPASGPARVEVLNWLFWQMGAAPLVGGGFGHFYVDAPVKLEYPINRYAMETKRQLDVLDRQLAEVPFVAGEAYSIADMAIWPWYGGLVLGRVYGAGEFLDVKSYTNLLAWAERLDARPAVRRGRMVNRKSGPLNGQLRERHDASDFDLRTQDKIGT